MHYNHKDYEKAIERYKIDIESEQYGWLEKFLNLLLEDQFVK